MIRRQPDEPETPTAWRLGFASGIMAFVSLISVVAYVGSIWVAISTAELEPPRTLGSPLRVTSGVDAVFLLTTQYETRVRGGGPAWMAPRGFEKVMHVDVWRFDPQSTQPVWRRRLLTERNGNILELGLMGADGDRFWIFLRQPMVLSAVSGEVLAYADMIEARNTALKGVLPRQLRHYSFFDGHGLAFTAADARAWILDAQTLVAAPWQPNEAKPRTTARGPAYFAPNSITSYQKRGLLMPGHWLGVLTDDEAEALKPKPPVPGERPGAYAAFKEYMHGPPDLSHAGPKRYRLWRAKAEQVSAAPAGWPKELPDKWGKRPKYSNFSVLDKSPEFLQAGLLSDGRAKLPLMLSSPDSVLILHRDRIDEDGRLHVTRIAGPDGRVMWDAALPLSILQSVMPSEASLLLFGRGYVPARPRNTDPYNTAHEWLISLDTVTGAVAPFNISTADEDRK